MPNSTFDFSWQIKKERLACQFTVVYDEKNLQFIKENKATLKMSQIINIKFQGAI